MSDTNTQTETTTSFQLCLLGPATCRKELVPFEESPVILMALMDEGCRLSFFVNPDWRTIPPKEDAEEIDLLLTDFAENARSNADALFERICTLNFGYLVTLKVETKIGNPSGAVALYPHFVPL